MLIEASKLLKIYIIKWQLALKEEQETLKDNPFSVEYEQILSTIREYLKAYIGEEIQKVIHDQQMLVFTNYIDRPFVRECKGQEDDLRELLTFAECKMGRSLTEYERAFLTYIFYNEVEDAILKGVWQLNLFNVKKLCIILQAGQEILYTDLQEMYAAYDSRKIWAYHLE